MTIGNRFRTVRMKNGVVPYGRVYYCHHFTRELVWRDEWRGNIRAGDMAVNATHIRVNNCRRIPEGCGIRIIGRKDMGIGPVGSA